MPRPLRLHVAGGFYHVTLRGNHRRNIFFRKAHRAFLNTLVAEVVERYQARVHAYCWMPNHIHMLVQVSDAPLGRIILRVASRYARTVQSHLNTTGHLFERRYHAVLVDAQAYLLELVRYIHLNPVRAKLALTPCAYPWSSHHVYLGQRDEPWVTTDFVLGMFHHDARRATASYQQFVACAPPNLGTPLAGVNEHDERVLGDDAFLAKVEGQLWRPRSRRTLEQLIAEACDEFGVSLEDLEGLGAQRRLTRVRAWIAQEALRGRIASLAAVARRLNRSESALRECVKRRTAARV